MMTSSNGNIFRVIGPLCGEFTGPGEFPAQRPVTLGFDVFFDLRLNKRLSKQPWGWWFETLSWSLWRHRNAMLTYSQLNHEEQNSLIYLSKLQHFHSRKCVWIYRMENGGHFVSASMCYYITTWPKLSSAQQRLTSCWRRLAGAYLATMD